MAALFFFCLVLEIPECESFLLPVVVGGVVCGVVVGDNRGAVGRRKEVLVPNRRGDPGYLGMVPSISKAKNWMDSWRGVGIQIRSMEVWGEKSRRREL